MRSWIDANQQVPEFYKFTGQSLPVLVVAETGDACFQQTMAVYRRGVAGGKRAFVWCASRFDDDRQGAVITVRCWMPPPKMPRDIPGKWDQEALAPAAAPVRGLPLTEERLREIWHKPGPGTSFNEGHLRYARSIEKEFGICSPAPGGDAQPHPHQGGEK